MFILLLSFNQNFLMEKAVSNYGINFLQENVLEEEGNNVWKGIGITGLEYITGSLGGFLWSDVFFPLNESKQWYYIPYLASGYSIFSGSFVYLTGRILGQKRSYVKSLTGAFLGGVLASFFIEPYRDSYNFKKYWYYETFPAIGSIIMDGTIPWGDKGRYGYELVFGGLFSLFAEGFSYVAIHPEGFGLDSPIWGSLLETGRSVVVSEATAYVVNYISKLNGHRGNLKGAMIGGAIGGLIVGGIEGIGMYSHWDFDRYISSDVGYAGICVFFSLPAIGAIIGNEM